jgi:polyisoprenyl-phosphate glycosyltransferase
MNSTDGLLSIVVPAFNEMENLATLHHGIAEHASRTGRPWELVLVDDGSSDGSAEIMKALAAKDPHVRYVQLSRNFGQQVAICAGLDAAAGDLIMLMDADLQDPPEEIPRFVAEIDKGYDLVFGVRQTRRDSLLTRISSHIFWRTIRWLSGFPIPENLAVMRIFNRRFLTEFQRFPERQKFIEGIFMWIGLRRATLAIPHHPRRAGRSKYNLRRKLALATTAITAFSERPLTIAISCGIALALTGLGFLTFIVARKLLVGYYAQGWVSTFGVVLLAGGIQTMFLGVLGKYIGRVFNEVKRRPPYVIMAASPARSLAELAAAPERALTAGEPQLASKAGTSESEATVQQSASG